MNEWINNVLYCQATYDPNETRGMIDYLLHQQEESRARDGESWLSDEEVKAIVLEMIDAGNMDQLLKYNLVLYYMVVSPFRCLLVLWTSPTGVRDDNHQPTALGKIWRDLRMVVGFTRVPPSFLPP